MGRNVIIIIIIIIIIIAGAAPTAVAAVVPARAPLAQVHARHYRNARAHGQWLF